MSNVATIATDAFKTSPEILDALTKGKITTQSAAEALDRLTPKAKPRTLTCKVSAKGCTSVYGLGRFPVTLYASQWEALLAFAPTIADFIVANGGTLVRK